MSDLETAARAFLDAYGRADSNRGCFSCADTHDLRCPIARELKGGECECGREQLDATHDALLELLATREGKGER